MQTRQVAALAVVILLIAGVVVAKMMQEAGKGAEGAALAEARLLGSPAREAYRPGAR